MTMMSDIYGDFDTVAFRGVFPGQPGFDDTRTWSPKPGHHAGAAQGNRMPTRSRANGAAEPVTLF